MDKMKTVRGLAKAGSILLKIAEIFCIIGAVGAFIGIACLAALPADLVQADVIADVTVKVNMARVMGRETWDEVKDSVAANLDEDDREVTVTDDGVEVKTGTTQNYDRGMLALSIAPSILTLAVAWFFCRTLGKQLRGIRDGGEPFRKEVADGLRTSGIALFVGAAAPALVYELIGLFAPITGSQGIDLVMVFAGLMLFAVAALLEAAEAKGIRIYDAPPAPPFNGTAAPGAPMTPAAPTEPAPEAPEAPKDDPNAF